MQYFNSSNLMLFRNSTPYLRKITERWQKLFLINSFGGDHGTSYILKTLDEKLASNIYYGDQLQIFYLQEEYLCPANEKLLKVMQNLYFRRKKD